MACSYYLAYPFLTNSNLVESEFALSAIGVTVPAIVGIIFFRKEIIESFTYFKEKTILKIVSIPMVVLLMIIVENSIMHFLNTGQPENQEQILTNGAEMPIIFTLLVFGIIGPIIEEIIFRYILVNRFFGICWYCYCIHRFDYNFCRSSFKSTFGYCYLFTWRGDAYCSLSYF